MKFFLITFALILFIAAESMSQGDTLIINMKNNQIEKIAVSQIKAIRFENVTSVEDPLLNSIDLKVKGNYPNPFAEQTSIEFEIAFAGFVEVFIYDNNGNHIQSLKCDNCQAGKNSLQWDCLDKNKSKVMSGVYYYEVRFNYEIQSKKMMLIK